MDDGLLNKRARVTVLTPKGYHYGGKIIREDADTIVILDDRDGLVRHIRRDQIAVLEVLA